MEFEAAREREIAGQGKEEVSDGGCGPRRFHAILASQADAPVQRHSSDRHILASCYID